MENLVQLINIDIDENLLIYFGKNRLKFYHYLHYTEKFYCKENSYQFSTIDTILSILGLESIYSLDIEMSSTNIFNVLDFLKINYIELQSKFDMETILDMNNQSYHKYPNIKGFVNRILRFIGLTIENNDGLQIFVNKKKKRIYKCWLHMDDEFKQLLKNIKIITKEELKELNTKITNDKLKIKHYNYEFKKYSMIENLTKMYLLLNNISFEAEFTRDYIFKHKRYDFELKYKNKQFIIETDGNFHFEMAWWYKNEDHFKGAQLNDIEKNIAVLKFNYNIIRFRTINAEKIIKILNYYLNLNTDKLFIAFENKIDYDHMINNNLMDSFKLSKEFEVLIYDDINV